MLAQSSLKSVQHLDLQWHAQVSSLPSFAEEEWSVVQCNGRLISSHYVQQIMLHLTSKITCGYKESWGNISMYSATSLYTAVYCISSWFETGTAGLNTPPTRLGAMVSSYSENNILYLIWEISCNRHIGKKMISYALAMPCTSAWYACKVNWKCNDRHLDKHYFMQCPLSKNTGTSCMIHWRTTTII